MPVNFISKALRYIEHRATDLLISDIEKSYSAKLQKGIGVYGVNRLFVFGTRGFAIALLEGFFVMLFAVPVIVFAAVRSDHAMLASGIAFSLYGSMRVLLALFSMGAARYGKSREFIVCPLFGEVFERSCLSIRSAVLTKSTLYLKFKYNTIRFGEGSGTDGFLEYLDSWRPEIFHDLTNKREPQN